MDNEDIIATILIISIIALIGFISANQDQDYEVKDANEFCKNMGYESIDEIIPTDSDYFQFTCLNINRSDNNKVLVSTVYALT